MRAFAALLLLTGPALAGPVDFGPSFIVNILVGALFYALYLIVPAVGYLLWRRGRRVVPMALAALWVTGAVIVPWVDWQAARLEARAHWDLRVMPEALPITGMSFLSDDTVRTPHNALNRFNDPGRLYGLYNRKESMAALRAGPVDFADFRFFENVHAPGRYKDRRTIDVPKGTRIAPDYIMLSGFFGDHRSMLSVMQHPEGHSFPPEFGAQFAILEVDDPAAFDLSAARMVMLVPYASESYYSAPFNPLMRRVYRAVPYSEEMALLIRYFCSDLDAETQDRCRRDI